MPDTAELKDKDSINDYVRSIIHALNIGIETSTLWSNPSPRSISGFD